MRKLFTLLVTMLLPMVAMADDSGKCGENLTWTYKESTKTLTIKGNGETYSYTDHKKSPWKNYRNDIVSISIETGITSIGTYVFEGISNLVSITFPNSLTSIDAYAFRDCANLSSITIPPSVTSIYPSAFSYCPNLSSINVQSGNPKYDSRENCNGIIDTESNTLVLGCKETVFPSSVTTIGARAFFGCTGLTYTDIPETITAIETAAFSHCSNLYYFVFPQSVKTIENSVLYACSSLVGVVIPNGATSVGHSSFQGCTKLGSIGIPNSVTYVGSGAFDHCTSMTVAVLPESLEKIELYTFRGCSSLNSIILPSTLKEIGIEAFKDTALEEVISYVQTPFPLDASVFSNYDTCKLIVPQGTLEKYQSTAAWNQFTTIVEDKTSGIEAAKKDIENVPLNRHYDLQGRKVANPRNGLYIIDGKKVVIK